MKVLHVPSVSGGKDSAATLLLCLDRIPKDRVFPIFCDTGNEHAAVYDYLDYLEKTLDLNITRLKADFSEQIAAKRRFIARDQRTGRDSRGRKLRWTNKAKRRALAVLQPSGNPFLDLCLWKGRFPSRKAQFCTQELKRDMAVAFQMNLIDQGNRVVSWQGIRHDESANRANAKKFEALGGGMFIYRPIVDWTALDVFAYCTDKGIEPNPLYKQGMGRVGCMPCVNVRKSELAEIAARFPEHIDRIEEWEFLVSLASKRGCSTFMYKNPKTEIRTRTDSRIFIDANIRNCVDWSKTSRGGKSYDFFASNIEIESCSSAYGLCE